MKILCVIDSLGSGGAQRQLVELAKGFKEKGHQVSFLVYHNEIFFKNVLDECQISVVAIIEPNYIRRLFKMRQYIRRGNFEVVLSFLEAANFICEIAGLPWRKWKLIVGERSANPNILKSIKLRFYRWVHVLADYVVANSNANLEITRKINPLLSASKCKVLYNIVDFDKWKSATDFVPFKGGKLNLIVVASHQYMKNAKGLITAIDKLNYRDKQRIKVDWYGENRADNSLNEAQNLVEKHSITHLFTFHNVTKDICQKMQHADVVGLFSFYEGLPNTICEGMVLGKPIISSAVSDVPKLLCNNLNLTFNPNSSDDISRVLSYILSLDFQTLEKIGQNNMTMGYRFFEKNKIILGYLDLFK